MASTSPSTKELRRMTAPAAPSSLSLPQGPPRPSGRPPSPLRNGFTVNTDTGIDPDVEDDDEDDEQELLRREWHERSPSPSSSVSQFAAQFAQRVGSFVGGIAQSPRQSPGYLPTDAELEAEAERERDQSRREAERIINGEAAERQQLEERVLAMLDSTKSLPPPPSRSQTMPNPPSPSGSQREGVSWWTATKNKLTPTKEPLTPAQQVIQDVKSKEKQDKKLSKGKGKEDNFDTFQGLNIPKTPQRRPIPNSSPSVSPSPVRPGTNMQINMTPSPMRNSPARSEGVPLYAQFNSEGALDVPSTLLTIAKRFEKLEKWTVGHVRALEERMNDVERWLVDKEEEKEEEKEETSLHEEQESFKRATGNTHNEDELREIREEIAELQGRLGELGREMAKLATSRLSAGPSKQSAHLENGVRAQSSFAVQETGELPELAQPVTPSHKFAPSTARESTSPPMAASHTKTPTGGTRLPYPTGDYTSPPDSGIVRSPPTSPTPAARTSGTRPLSIAGLPSAAGNPGLGISQPQPSSASVASTSYSSGSFSAASSMTDLHSELSAPKMPAAASPPRQSSTSPTPRKRYTVALGTSIRNPSSSDNPVYSQGLSTSPALTNDRELEDDDEDGELGGETIGKSAAARLHNRSNSNATQERPSRIRPQSTYGFSSVQTPVSPVKPRTRSHSIDRFASTDSLASLSSTSSKFVDPLIERRRERKETIDKVKSTMPKVEKGKKVPVGQLVAFFDERKK